MFKQNRNINILVCIIAITALTTLVSATPITTFLNKSNENLGISGNFATVTVSMTSTPNQVQFTVDVNNTLLTHIGSNFGIQSFGFNTGLSLAHSDFILPSGWNVKVNQNLSDFGIFDEDVYKHSGGVRWDPLIFYVTNSSITNESNFFVGNSEGYHYAAHIAGFTELNGKTSAWFADGSSIPEPITPILLGLGLLSLTGVKRKK